MTAYDVIIVLALCGITSAVVQRAIRREWRRWQRTKRDMRPFDSDPR